MDPALQTLAALLLLVSAASCAPAAPPDACADLRSSTLELNTITKKYYERNDSRDEANFTSSPWIEAKDMCDPGTLRRKSVTCIGKLYKVLRSYESEVAGLAEVRSCSAFVGSVQPLLRRVRDDMAACLRSKGETQIQMGPPMIKASGQDIPAWCHQLVCNHTVDRLFSFSILTARVFAVGDPARHEGGAAHACA